MKDNDRVMGDMKGSDDNDPGDDNDDDDDDDDNHVNDNDMSVK